MTTIALGEPVPQTAHAVSVSLPTWKSNVGYEEGEEWVVSRMKTGYPRFFIHLSIEALAQEIIARFAPGKKAMLFPQLKPARRCLDFIRQRTEADQVSQLSIVNLVLDPTNGDISPLLRKIGPTISAVAYPETAFPIAKQYWQHTGDGISSRRAEFCMNLLKDGLLVSASGSASSITPGSPPRPVRGPRRYHRPGSLETAPIPPPKSQSSIAETSPSLDSLESSRFLEERYGRNLDLTFVERATSAIRRRIAGSLTHEVDLHNGPLPTAGSNTRGIQSLAEDDVYLYPTGMNAIYNAHRTLLGARGDMKSVEFGFPYVDTLKILEKFGPGCLFYGRASSEELDDLEARLKKGERFLALFCEFPGNPLLTCPDLDRIRRLADEFDFAVVVDETIGTFANINVLPVADVVVSSLTKIFSGDGNVMGGAMVLNPESKYYPVLKKSAEECYENSFWPEDIIFLERNSRDFVSRIDRINTNAETICSILQASPLVKTVHYPKFCPSKACYEARRLPNGGYGGLLSVIFHRKQQAERFYDELQVAKGPSLGTNFTLVSPYVLLAHYNELDWAREIGVDPDLIRMSVGLEETEEIRDIYMKALKAAEAV